MLLSTAGSAVESDARRIPSAVTLPLVVFDVDWSDQAVGEAPQRPDKAWFEAVAADPWQALPWRTHPLLDYVTRDRTAVIADYALGLTDRPVVFTAPDGRHPHWGPRMWFGIPDALAAVGWRWRVSLDVSIDNVTRMGGISLVDVAALTFFEDGKARFGKTELALYRRAAPLHLEFVVDVPNRTCTRPLQ